MVLLLNDLLKKYILCMFFFLFCDFCVSDSNCHATKKQFQQRRLTMTLHTGKHICIPKTVAFVISDGIKSKLCDKTIDTNDGGKVAYMKTKFSNSGTLLKLQQKKICHVFICKQTKQNKTKQNKMDA